MSGAKQVFRAEAMADFSYRVPRASGNGWLAVGDAGGVIDPLFSTGFHLAVKGADLYNVSIQLSDGRRRFFLLHRKPHPVRLGKLAAGTHGFVLVSAQRRGERHGPVARAKLKAKHRRH